MIQHNDWSAMQQSSYHDMQVDSLGAFSARNPLDSLAVTVPGRTRCVNAENPTGGKGTAATAASALGPSRKGSPLHPNRESGGECHFDECGRSGRDPPYLDDRHRSHVAYRPERAS